jgi:hypothetical protein
VLCILCLFGHSACHCGAVQQQLCGPLQAAACSISAVPVAAEPADWWPTCKSAVGDQHCKCYVHVYQLWRHVHVYQLSYWELA